MASLREYACVHEFMGLCGYVMRVGFFGLMLIASS
jgi:hypothetical protein